MLKRKLKSQIQEWIQDGKEALLVTGARQVGKTFLIRECLNESKQEFVEEYAIEQAFIFSQGNGQLLGNKLPSL